MFTHRPLSSSFLWFFLESYKVTPKRNYLGAYGYIRAAMLCSQLQQTSGYSCELRAGAVWEFAVSISLGFPRASLQAYTASRCLKRV